MSEQLKEGWYWTKDINHDHPDYWACQYWSGSVWEGESSPMVIGPRIPTPDEPWQSVPKEPTPAMMVEGLKIRVEEDSTGSVYRAMLSAAPKPEDV